MQEFLELEIKKARKQTMDLIESVYGHTDQWQHVRKRLLRIFGRDGLEGILENTERRGINENE